MTARSGVVTQAAQSDPLAMDKPVGSLYVDTSSGAIKLWVKVAAGTGAGAWKSVGLT